MLRSAAVGLRDDTPLAPLRLDFGVVPSAFDEARINVHGVHHPERNCELRFFVGGDRPVAGDTPQTIEHGFLGSYLRLGHGSCPGAPGHCDPDQQLGDKLRPPHHLAPFDIYIDVAEAIRAMVDRGPAALAAEMIIVDDVTLAQMPTATVRFDNASLTFR